MKRYLSGLLSLFLLFFFGCGLLVPVFFLGKEALFIEGQFSFHYFTAVFGDRVLLGALVNSANIALLTTVITLLAAFPAAVCMVRLKVPGRWLIEQLMIAPLFLPPFVGVLGLRQFIGRSGTLNVWLESAGVINSPIDFLGSNAIVGIAIVQALHLYPLVYLSLVSAFASMNAELEDAATSVGAGRWSLYTRIVIPLIASSIISSALLVFVGSFTDIGTPLLFEYRRAVPVIILNSLSDLEQSGPGYALVSIVGFCAASLFLISRYFERTSVIVTSARSFKPFTTQKPNGILDRMLVAYLFVLIGVSLLPHLGVLLQAFAGYWFMTPLPEEFTTAHFSEVFSNPVASSSLLYSLVLSVAATLITICVGLTVAWKTVRNPGRWSWILEFTAMIPLAIPGVVIAFGYVIGYAGTPLDNRGNPTALLILAYSIRKLPFMVRVLTSGLRSASRDLESAARVFGASASQVIRRITIPLLFPSLIAGSILCFLGCLLEVSDSLILAMEERYFPIAKALYVLQGRPDGPPVACALALIVMCLIIGGMYAAARMSGRQVTQLMRGAS